MARYLVTGGCGFIGSHLVDALMAKGHRVRVLDDLSTGRRDNLAPEAELIVGDIRDRARIDEAMAGIDGCFHLAAIASVVKSIEHWAETHTVNLTGALHVFDAARRQTHRPAMPVVYASSAAVYGDRQDPLIDESAVATPLTAYGADKLGCELHGRVASTVHGVPTTGLRFFNVYGPRQDPRSPYSGVISIFCDRLRRRLPLEIYGDGEQVRDFIYVSDVVAFLIHAMNSVSLDPAIFNVCTGAATSVNQLAALIAAQCGTEPVVTPKPPRRGDIRRSVGNPARAGEKLGYHAKMVMREGLALTLASEAPRNT